MQEGLEDLSLRFFARRRNIQRRFVSEGYFLDEDFNEFHLQNLCRKWIRKNLLKIYPHENLFVLIEDLPLPQSVKIFLLYDTSLEPEEDDC